MIKELAVAAFHHYRMRWKGGRPAPVFIVSHMRSGSSLLLHLLVDHPEITGRGERNAAYHTDKDISREILRTRLAGRAWRDRSRYWVDQVNHNDYTPPLSLLNAPEVKVIYLLREPSAAIASLLRLSDRFYGGRWTREAAEAYYCERLAFLRETGAGLSGEGRALLLTYEELTGAPAEVLRALTAFLELKRPLPGTYRPQPFTGRRGDPGERIFAGRILQEQKKRPPKPAGAEARRAFEEGLATLRLEARDIFKT